MKISIRGFMGLIAWLALVLSLWGMAKSEVVNPPGGWATSISVDLLCGLNLIFSMFAVLLAIGYRKERSEFWIGASVIAGILTALQVTDSFPRDAAGFGAEKMLRWLIATYGSSGSGSNWFSSHRDQWSYLLLYSWTPLLAVAGGVLVVLIRRKGAQEA